MTSDLKKYTREYRALSRLGFPVLLTQVGIIAMGFADTIMLGRYGVAPLAASAFVNSIFMIPMVMLMGLANGLTPLVGALFGRNDHAGIGRTLRGGVQLNVIAGIVATVILAAIYLEVDLFGQDPNLVPLIREYFIVVLFSVLPLAIFNAFQQLMNGMTDTSVPMWMILIATVTNIFGNWLLIFGNWGFPEMGLRGAALATLLSRVFGCIAIILVFCFAKRYKGVREAARSAHGLGGIRRRVWVTSYPVAIQSGVEVSLWTLGAVVCGWYGAVELAAYQITNTLGQLGFMIFMSIGVAVSIRVANYAGQHDAEGCGLAARAGFRINLVLATLASLVFIFGGKHLLGIFTTDEAVLSSALTLLPPLVLYQYLDATQYTFCSAIRGTSQVKPLLWISLVSYIAVGIPILLIFAEVCGWENVGVYYSFCVALLAAAIYSYLAFRRLSLP